MAKYDYSSVEKKWQKFWEENETFKTDVWDFSKPKFYALDMFPYPSGVGLHAGHPEGYTATDIVSRYKRMKGFEALWLPGTDHAAIATEAKVVEKLKKEGLTKYDLGREKFNEEIEAWYKKYKGAIIDQFKLMGYSCDWDRLCFTLDENGSGKIYIPTVEFNRYYILQHIYKHYILRML